MSAELKLFEVTADPLRRFVRIKRDEIPHLRGAEQACGRLRIGVTDEENIMLWVLDDPARENIRERFRRHHSAGERVEPSRTRGRIVNGLAVQDEWRDFLE